MSSHFAVVGLGRAGHSVRRALTDVGWRCVGHYGRDFPPGLLANSEAVFLAVPDGAIATVADQLTPGPGAVIHLSGASDLDVLAPHKRRASVHPLVSLPDGETGAKRLLDGAWFAVAGDPIANEVVAALGGKAFTVEAGQRVLYHAAAAVAANHLVVLCAQVERLAAQAQVPATAYWQLMGATLENVTQLGAPAALTGPAARGDTTTVQAHLAALPASERDLYQIMADHAARVAGVAMEPPRPALSPNAVGPSPNAVGPSPTVPSPNTVRLISSIGELRPLLDQHRANGETVGFVPTMGYLHDGHASLMRAASAETTVTVASIFVNPLQFAPDEDLSSYPRDLDRDLAVAAEAGVDVVFAPSTDEMYPNGAISTTVSVGPLAQRWEGQSRPTHFDGVATVVAKLFNIVGPCRAYFGEKDYQQLAVIRAMAADLSAPVEVIGCPIVREPDGLAMSSRNVYLSPAERAAAPVLRRALGAGADLIANAEATSPDEVTDAMRALIAAEPLARLDYVAVVDANTLEPATVLSPTTRVLVAAFFGTTRLIDNLEAGSPNAH